MKTGLPLGLILAALVAGGSWAGFLGTFHLSGKASLIDRAETVLLDTRIGLTGTRTPPDSVAVVVIDDETVAEAGHYPLDRRQLARLVDRVRLSGARAMAIDMLLVDASDPESDAILAAALDRFPVVIAGAAQFDDPETRTDPVPAPKGLLKPLPLFASAADVALVNVATDSGGTPRQIPMLFDVEPLPETSIVLRAAGLHQGEMPVVTIGALRVGSREVPLDLGWHLNLNYYGAAGTIGTTSARDLLAGEETAKEMDGKLVMLGVTALGVGDRFTTPFDQIMPGVEVLATGVSNLLDGSALVRNGTIRWIDVIAAVLITLTGIVIVALLPLAVGSATVAALLLGWLAVTTVAFTHFYWLNAALPIAAALPPVIAVSALRQVLDRRIMRRMSAAQLALGRFQSAKIANRIAADPAFLAEPVEQHAAILFIDLVGYTALSERLGARSTRDFLKVFHTLVVEEAERRNGLVMDFMGDGVMVGFGIPDTTEDDAANAVAAAFDLVRTVRQWLVSEGLDPHLEAVRVGAHFGTVVLSRLGHEKHQQVATTGDCVNVASRLLEVARSRVASLVLSYDLVKAARLEKIIVSDGRAFEMIAIRGRQQSVAVAVWTAAEAVRQADDFPS